MRALVVFSFYRAKPRDWRLVERLRNDLFCVEWDVKPPLNQSTFMHFAFVGVLSRRRAVNATTASHWTPTPAASYTTSHTHTQPHQGCSPKKLSGGTPETRLRQRFFKQWPTYTYTHTRQKKCHSGSLVLSCDTATRV